MNKIILNANHLVINALTAIKNKNYIEAKNLLEKAISIQPEMFEANHNLAILNLQLGNLDSSILYFEKSKKIKPKFPQIYFNLGLAYDRKNNIDLAIINFKKVNKLDPNNPVVLHNIGHLYTKKFETIKAEEYLIKSLDLDPNRIITYDELFSLYDRSNQIEKFSNLLDKAKKILSEKDLVSYYEAVFTYNQKNFKQTIQILENIDLKENYVSQNINKHSLLAKSYDQTSNFEKAYNHFKINNQLMNESYGKGVNEKSFIELVTQRINFFKNFNINRWKQHQLKDEFFQPIFLIGFPRSGTTLLDTILRTNKSIEIIEEKPVLRNFLRNLDIKIKNNFNHLDNLDKKFIQNMQNFYFEEREQYLENKKTKIVIDKMPLNIIYIAEILRFFPNAKFIFALRNPYDSILSCFMQQFELNPAMKNFTSLESSVILYDLVMKLWTIYRDVFSINCHFIKYEDLVTDFEKTTKEIFKFLEIDWSDNTKNFYMTAKKRLNISTPSYNQITSPLYSRSIGRWKNYEKEFKGLKNILDPWLDEFNYKI
ncbi:sulfotransferase [Candidatus Pelagibacter ubique]|nr:sulfotransferase [Candidatus Pelagibacter ubique]